MNRDKIDKLRHLVDAELRGIMIGEPRVTVTAAASELEGKVVQLHIRLIRVDGWTAERTVLLETVESASKDDEEFRAFAFAVARQLDIDLERKRAEGNAPS